MELLDDDNEWDDALIEASTLATGNQLRSMFSEILMFCELKDPNELWNKYWVSLSDDLQSRYRRTLGDSELILSDDELKNLSLTEKESILTKNGRSLSEFSSIPFSNNNISNSISNRLLREEISYDIESLKIEFNSMYPYLNEHQKIIFEKLISASTNKTGSLFFCKRQWWC